MSKILKENWSNKKSSKTSFLSDNTQANNYENRIGLVYARVSSKRQETEGSGLQSQESRCINDLKIINVPYIKSFLDSITGGGDFRKRPAMTEMLDYIDANPHKKFVVVFDDLKRLARDVVSHFELKSAFKSRGVLLRCPNYNFNDSDEGWFSELVSAGGAELERRQNRRQVIQKQLACLERGYWPFRSLYGYTKGKTAEGKKDMPNEKNNDIKELFEGFFSGRFQQFTDGVRFLQEKGLFGKAHPEKYIMSLKSILMQPFYAGFIEYPAWEVTRRKGIHEATVSPELFEIVQKKITRNFNVTKVRQDINPDFPLRGCVNCIECAGKLTAAWCKGKKEKHPYYFCQNKKCPLKGKTIRKKDLEDNFSSLLEKMTTEDDILELAKAVFVDAKEVDEREQVSETKTNEKRIQECEAEIDRYATLAGKSRVESVVAQYERQIEKLANELEGLQSSKVAEYDYGVPYRTALDKMTGILKQPCKTWVELDIFQQQKFFSFLFEQNLVYGKKEGYRTPKYTVLKRVCEQIELVGSANVEMGGVEPPCK